MLQQQIGGKHHDVVCLEGGPSLAELRLGQGHKQDGTTAIWWQLGL